MKLKKELGFWGVLLGIILIFASNTSAVLGADWSEVNPSPTVEDLEGVTFGDERIVAVGDNGTILTSLDGVIWDSSDAATNKELRGVAWSGSQFAAVGNKGTIVTRLSSEVAWTPRNSNTSHKLRGVTSWGDGHFVAVGNFGTIVTSTTGETWIVVNAIPTGEDLNGVTAGNDHIVAVGDNGTILTSSDGADWNSPDSDTHRDLEDVAWSGMHFVAVGNEGTIVTSPSGEVWTSQGSVTNQRFKAVTWGGTQFVAVGDEGAIFTSPDGLVWTSQDSGTNKDLEGVTWDGTQFVAVGGAGTILTRLVRGPDIVVIDAVDPVSDLQILFGKVTIDFTSDKAITIANTGNADLVIGTIALDDPLEAPFSIIDDNACSGRTLIPAEICTLTVKFAPTDTGVFTDSFGIPSNDADEDPVIVNVSGEGVGDVVSDITVTDSVGLIDDLTILFGDITVGNQEDQTLTISNDGSDDLAIGAIALVGPFSIVDDLCSNHTLAPGETCTLTVRFEPDDPGPFNGTFDIPSNDPDEETVTISVSGTGLPEGVGGNNPPSAPLLLFPANGQTHLGSTVTLRWLPSLDPDGDTITYTVSICENPDFTGVDCGPTVVAFLGKPAVFFATLGSSGAGLLLFGFVFVGGVQGRKRVALLIAMIITTGMLLTACSSGSGGGGAGAPAGVTHTVSNLNPGTTFHWKVTADDGNGGTTDSATGSFTTAP